MPPKREKLTKFKEKNIGNLKEIIHMNNPIKNSFQELELQEFKLPTSSNSQSDDLRIPLISQTENPIYKPVRFVFLDLSW